MALLDKNTVLHILASDMGPNLTVSMLADLHRSLANLSMPPTVVRESPSFSSVPYLRKTMDMLADDRIERLSMTDRSTRFPRVGEIIWSPYTVKATCQRNFPASRHRSRRIHKKLCRRFGGEFVMVPAIWEIGGRYYAHPSFRDKLQAAMGNRVDALAMAAFMGQGR